MKKVSKVFHQLFQEQVEKNPEKIAVICRDQKMTYQELNNLSNQLARYIRAQYTNFTGNNISPDTIVTLFLEKNIDMLIAILGILKAGAAYTPIDISYPKSRILYILENNNSPLLLTQSGLYQKFFTQDNLKFKSIFMDEKPYQSEECNNLESNVQLSDLAYVIYTSGTTGNPKGVMIEHKAFSSFICGFHKKLKSITSFTKYDVLSLSSYVFDIFGLEYGLPLATGGKIILSKLENVEKKEILQCTLVQQTPSVLQQLIQMYPNLFKEKLCLVGGEALSPKIANDLLDEFSQVINVYGPAETTIWSTCALLKKNNPIYIGQPLDGEKVFVLDKRGQLVSPQTKGELYIAGIGLARGYLNDANLTAEKFIENPFVSIDDQLNGDARLYKTGDLVQWSIDGNLEYIGRSDFQIKLRGHRIELAEIEAALISCYEVKQACVVVDSHFSVKNIIAYYHSEKLLEQEILKRQLSKVLPQYMIPNAFVWVEKFSITTNGKIDRKKLPTCDIHNNNHKTYIAPRNQLETLIQSWMRTIFRLDEISIEDDFFKIGGDSILSIRLASVFREHGYLCDSQFVFKHRTIAHMAEHLQKNDNFINSNENDSRYFDTTKINSQLLDDLQHKAAKDLNEIQAIFPANMLQRSFIYQYLRQPNDSTHHVQMVFEYNQSLNVENYHQAWLYVVERYPALRTFFNITSDIIQVVYKKGSIIFRYRDISNFEGIAEKDPFIKNILEQDRVEYFNLCKLNLFRIYLVKFDSCHFKVILSYHHCIIDGISEKIILDELHHYYSQLESNYPCTIKQDEAYLKAQLYYTRDHIEALNYWEKEIDSFRRSNNFPNNSLKNNSDSIGQSKEIYLSISNDSYRKLKLLILETGLTLNVLIQFTWHKLIQTYTQDEQTVVGTIVSGRDVPISGVNQSVGLYLNTLPLQVDWVNNKTSLDILREIHEKISELNGYSQIDLSRLRKDDFLLFDSVILFNPVSRYESYGDPLLTINSVQHIEKLPYSIAVMANDFSDQLEIKLLYQGVQVSDHLAERYLQQFKIILFQLPEKLTYSWSHISILTDVEYKKIILTWNDTRQLFHQDQLVHRIFEEQVLKNPDRIALVFEKKKLTYAELNRLSNQLAYYIHKRYMSITGKPLLPNTLIAICVSRGIDMIIGILGILKCGGAYVPIDPDYPAERVNYILEETQTKLILTQTLLLSKYSFGLSYIDLEKKVYENEKTDNLPSLCGPHNLAYVLYTSGTTGKPKGVMIEHSGIPNFIFGFIKDNHLQAPFNIGSFLSIGFDAIGSEIYTALFSGSTLYIASDETRKNIEALSNFLQDNRIEIAAIPAAIINVLPVTKYPRKIVIMGDTCATYHMQKWWNTGHQVMNGYGPTEVTIGCTGAIYDGRKNTIIGKPMDNRVCYILDVAMNPVPVGVVGELYIGGVGLAQGYLNNKELSNERFVENPFVAMLPETAEYKRLYKTGDLSKWLDDGNIEYIGRKDFQLKIRGFRVELSEIESTLLSFPGMQQCTLIVNEIDDVSRAKYIVAYYVSNQKNCENELRQYLFSKLPDYMIPRYLVPVDAIPINENGKIDKNKLPSPKTIQNSNSVKVVDRTAEGKLRAIWEEILGVPAGQIKESDSFFDLGGNSVSVMLLKDKIITYFGLQISVADFFKSPTLSNLVDLVSNRLNIDNLEKNNEMQIGIHEDIAIIGLSGMFSGCSDIDDFWKTLKEGRESISVKNVTADNEIHVDSQTLNIDTFDPNFWNISFEDAKLMDPQIRKFLEICWDVLEKSGYIKKRHDLSIGVFAGCGSMNYLGENILKSSYKNKINSWEVNTANGKDFLTTRVSYLLGLRGPSVNVNTTCSTSLVAVVEACEKISSGKCDMALAGGVSFLPSNVFGYTYEEGRIFSKDGHCRALDDSASGTTLGSGCGVVLLKSLQRAKKDKDTILAVIKGYAVNNDGNLKISYTAPSASGQTDCILKSQKMAGINSNDISYIECHGTGTRIGDAIEFRALVDAFGNTSDQEAQCILGAVKANIGHADSAAGIAGLTKICKMLEEDLIVKQVNYTHPNDEFNIENTPFLITTVNKKWSEFCNAKTRIAGISSFGIGGTNAHLIVTEFEQEDSYLENVSERSSNNTYFIPLSAKSDLSLKTYKEVLFKYLYSNPTINIRSLAHTLQMNREHYTYRSCITCTGYENLLDHLKSDVLIAKAKVDVLSNQPIVFMFPGQGTQFENMGLPLYQSDDFFKMIMDEGIAIINQLTNVDFKKILYPDLYPRSKKIGNTDSLQETCWAQPALFLTCYATARFLQHIGVHAVTYIGHSIGEYVAATLAGAISFADCIEGVVLRGQLMQESPVGEMLAIHQSSEYINDLLLRDNSLEIAAINSPTMCVVSGSEEKILNLKKNLAHCKVASKILHTKRAFHSRLMKNACKRLIDVFEKIKFKPIPYGSLISNISGDFFEENNSPTAEYFGMHMLKPVEFSKGISAVMRKFIDPIFIEIGPGVSLTSFVAQHQEHYRQEMKVLNTIGRNIENHAKNEIIKKLWLFGLKINIMTEADSTSNGYNLYHLPTYQFLKKSFWIHPQENNSTVNLDLLDSSKEMESIFDKVVEANCLDIEYKIARVFVHILGSDSLSIYDSFYNLGGNSLSAVRLLSELKKIGIVISLSDLVNIDTIDKISRFYSTKISYAQSMSIIIPLTINHDKKNKNVFFIHPVGGSVISYQKISNRLSEKYNYYGIQNININGRQLIQANTLEELAQIYLEEILKVQNEGRFILTGSSMGGTIAYELAIQLVNKGHDIQCIGMFDSWAAFPESFNDQSTFDKVMQEQDRQFAQLLVDVEENQKQYLQEARWQLMTLLLNYKVKKSNLMIDLFKAKELDQYHQLNGNVKDNYWASFTAGKVNIYLIDGNHETIHDEPGLSQIVCQLNKQFIEVAEVDTIQ